MSQAPRRRFLITAGALVAAPLAARAQRADKQRRIGMLLPVRPADAAPYIEAFREGLRELGYVEARQYVLLPRYSEGQDDRFAGLSTELVNQKVDVIVTWGTSAARAARRATRTTPIVTAAVVDPVGTGLISGLARPGGNVTGVTSGGAALSRKTLELLRELLPDVKRVAVLWNPANPVQPVMLRETQLAADTLKIRLQSVSASEASDLDSAFASIRQEKPGALIVLQDPMLHAHRDRILDFVATMRLPAVYERQPWVDAGGLISYGVNFTQNFRRAAGFVDRIFKGASPANLPVEDPIKYELVVNLRSAKALGIAIPQSVLLRADKVLE